MRRTLYTAFAVLGMAALAWGARRPGYDYEVRCEVQTATAELGDLIWSQGSTPLVCAVPTKRGAYIGSDAATTVRMMIAESATSRLWAVVTNQATNATGYLIQWPTIGTNTAAKAPWYYTIYFERDGHRYWTGSGSLWIEATTATEDGLEWVEVVSGAALPVATNALRIAEETAAALGGYVVKTNGEWVIRQGEAWNGIEWCGERIFGALLDVDDTGAAEILGVEALSTNSLMIRFRGAATNRLEACAEPAATNQTWTTWDAVEWVYEGEGFGTATVADASPDHWYRIAAVGDVSAWSNAAVVSYVPLYQGAAEEGKRVVTREELEAETARKTTAATRDLVRASGHTPEMTPGDETDLLWSFGPGGVYIRGLEIGKFRIGESYVTNFSQIADKVVCKGGWKWPDWFRVAEVRAGASGTWRTNETCLATNAADNARSEIWTSSELKGWRIETEIIRKANESDSIAWAPVEGGDIAPGLLVAEGDTVLFADGVDSAAVTGRTAWARGTLGGFTADAELAFDASRQATNAEVFRFGGAVPGSLLEHCWTNVLGAASNGWSASPQKDMGLRLWPEGHGDGQHPVPATWNSNFWGMGLGDFSCVSYHTETPEGVAGGVYRPIVMVTERHGIVADHWKPHVGANCRWVSRGGAVLTNQVEAYQNIRGDLTVARMERAFSTNEVLPATLLATDYPDYTRCGTNALHGWFGFPCLSFDCAERGWVSGWAAAGASDTYSAHGLYTFGEGAYDGPYKGNGQAVGGDSGSPTFFCVDGRAVLLGCFLSAPGGGPMPNKAEVDAAIAERWGDEERCREYSLQDGGWTNYGAPGGPAME